MANPYTTSIFRDDDADLIEELNDDLIYDKGIGVKYMMQEKILVDKIMNENVVTRFDDAVDVDVFIEAQSGGYLAPNHIFDFAGFSYGRDTTTVHFSRRRIEATLGRLPHEGDVFYVRELDQLLELTDVDVRDPFMSGGNYFVITGSVVPYAPGEGSQHFSDNNMNLSDSVKLLMGTQDPDVIIDDIAITADSTMFSADHNWYLLGYDKWTEPFTADNDWVKLDPILDASTTLITADSTVYTADMTGQANAQKAIQTDKRLQAVINKSADNNNIDCPEITEIDRTSDNNPFEFL